MHGSSLTCHRSESQVLTGGPSIAIRTDPRIASYTLLRTKSGVKGGFFGTSGDLCLCFFLGLPPWARPCGCCLLSAVLTRLPSVLMLAKLLHVSGDSSVGKVPILYKSFDSLLTSKIMN